MPHRCAWSRPIPLPRTSSTDVAIVSHAALLIEYHGHDRGRTRPASRRRAGGPGSCRSPVVRADPRTEEARPPVACAEGSVRRNCRCPAPRHHRTAGGYCGSRPAARADLRGTAAALRGVRLRRCRDLRACEGRQHPLPHHRGLHGSRRDRAPAGLHRRPGRAGPRGRRHPEGRARHGPHHGAVRRTPVRAASSTRVMREVKRLCDPAGILNPGVLISDDAESHLAHLKLTPVVEPEVDRCVECGYCEPVCPSKDVTITPRQRIAVRRARAAATSRGDLALDGELARAETYNSVETCAVDGMCQTACPVLINTGILSAGCVSRTLRAATQGAGRAAAAQWAPVTRVAATALTVAKWLPAPVVRGASDAARSCSAPMWCPAGLPTCLPAARGGQGWSAAGSLKRRRRPCSSPPAQVRCSDLPTGSIGAAEAFRRLCARAGVGVVIPPSARRAVLRHPVEVQGTDRRVCRDGRADGGQPRGRIRRRTVADRQRTTPPARRACCTRSIRSAASGGESVRLRVIDSVDFAAAELLPHLRVQEQVASIVLHPTCASTRLGTNEGLRAARRRCVRAGRGSGFLGMLRVCR